MKKTTLLLVTVSMVLSGIALFVTLLRLAPLEDTGWLAMLLFFTSLFIFVSSLTTLLGSLIRMFLYKHETYFFHFVIALRQGMLFAFFTCALAWMSMLYVANWWNIGLLFASILSIELYFLNRESLV